MKMQFTFEEWRAICEVISYFLLATSFVSDKFGTKALILIGIEIAILAFCFVRMDTIKKKQDKIKPINHIN